MPIIKQSSYKPTIIYRNQHFNTLYPALWRKVFPLDYQRVRMTTFDQDFLDLDWSVVGAENLLICLHGLEGNARRHYMAGMMKIFNQGGINSDGEKWDAVAFNYRGCSGEDNRMLYGYHSGWTKDLDFFIKNLLAEKPNSQIFPNKKIVHYKRVILVGFSVGGNIALKYGGEQGKNLAPQIKKIIALSVPIDLAKCSEELEKRHNALYLWQFLRTLKQKAREKASRFPHHFDVEKVVKAKNFRDFDDHFTAPINGFRDASHYWHESSSIHFLTRIEIPTLLVNALDDTFLSKECFPTDVAAKKDNFYLEMPRYGGHLGFMSPDKAGFLWTEKRAWDFASIL